MPDWKLWRDMGQASLIAARSLQNNDPRSAVSRFYYAAYQMASACVLYRNHPVPLDREAWSHADTPGLLREHLRVVLASADKRKDLYQRLRLLYKARCNADYVSSIPVSKTDVEKAKKDAAYIIKSIEAFLPRS